MVRYECYVRSKELNGIKHGYSDVRYGGQGRGVDARCCDGGFPTTRTKKNRYVLFWLIRQLVRRS